MMTLVNSYISRPRWRSSLIAAAMLSGLLLAGGCESARVEQSLVQQHQGDDLDAQMAFWHSLAEAPVTSNDDALHGLILFLDSSDPATDYAQRVDTLKNRQILPASFNAPAEEAISRGTLAVALSKALDVRGGVMVRLTKNAPRYAVRELEFLGLYPPSSPHQTFSGAEYVGVIGRAEDYMARGARGKDDRTNEATRTEHGS